MGEMNLYGIYIPILLVQAIIAYVLFKLLSPLIDRLVIKGWIALPSIFNLCFYLGLMLLVHCLFVWLWG
ncbi:DUF1656 domain-containing protein [Acinetobacter gyllenbergii]|uniref:DUF1656 domain-containing protein n=1 Tax=Acinetobacter gyllenbergii CIP 110306 = MTCC 11365 TaxID=1217657 RepID=A0A829HDF3_9GAMM|nr:DUF1656 domain-containing protein [Acinetobacter gyllenbergii]EPF75519.1 hypothetical protein F957_03083 [Acinetobacter gyllenbergii CIP 110306 = MTCC 11365]EPH31932.1 hypothetical protein L293_1708 [Acinetobacter gyllenbergii CIP 110306 = MTCC 11365]ESK39417.1 hypothetical protein F987_02786 [Acinetobacter gyllenbergii NIPH 230]MCU4580671.1 DUF1656 domain-containing protein [Acinetobacter gyllenbergii]OBY73388.1 hypothetical protein NG55_14300 [Acinetobacter gyllenbergii]